MPVHRVPVCDQLVYDVEQIQKTERIVAATTDLYGHIVLITEPKARTGKETR